MEDAVFVEWHVPGTEHVAGDGIAIVHVLVDEAEQRLAVEPGHAQEPVGAQVQQRFGNIHAGLVRKHSGVDRDVPGLAIVIQLLAQTRRQFGVDVGRVDGAVVTAVDGEHQLELLEVRFDRRGHVRVLQLAGQPSAVVGGRPVDLSQRGGGGGLVLERGEPLLPVRTQLGGHPPLDEGPAHRWRVGLELRQLRRVLLGQQIGYGGENLRHLHQRPLEPAQRRREFGGVLGTIDRETEEPPTGIPRGQSPDRGANPGVAADPAAQGILIAPIPGRRLVVVGHGYATRSIVGLS